MTFHALFGHAGHAGGNLSVNGDVGDAHSLQGSDEGARFAGVPLEKSFALESVDVLHDRGLTGEAEVALDLASARRHAFLALLALDEIENALLPRGQHADIIGRR